MIRFYIQKRFTFHRLSIKNIYYRYRHSESLNDKNYRSRRSQSSEQVLIKNVFGHAFKFTILNSFFFLF